MASGRWESSRRRSTLPSNWSAIRQRALTRDKRQCQIRSAICIGTATDVDHIGSPDDHRLEMLRSACGPCHGQRSGQQGGTASGHVRRARTAARKRPTEAHPGLVHPGGSP